MYHRLIAILNRHYIPLVIGMGLLLRLLWILVVDWTPVSDGAWYVDRAVSLMEGKGYVAGGQPTALFPPGYPALLAAVFLLTGPSVLAGQMLNLVASAAILLFAYLLARRWFASEKTARLTLLILAFYPNYLVYHTLLLTELVFTALLLAGVFFFSHSKKGKIAWAGLLFAAAVYVKPQVALLPALLWLGKGRPFRQDALQKAGLVYGILAMLILPWFFRNQDKLGAWVFTTNGGYNFFIGNNPLATGTYGFEGGAGDLLPEPENELDRDRKARDYAFRYVTAHPLEALLRIPKKWYYLFWMGNEGVYWHKMAGNDLGRRVSQVVELGYRLLLLGFLLHGILSLRASYRKRGGDSCIPLWIILYFLAVYAVFFGYSRYHFPLIPFFVMYAAEGLRRMLRIAAN